MNSAEDLIFGRVEICYTGGMKTIFTCLSLVLAASLSAAASEKIFLGSRPSVSSDGSMFVFEWADNIWTASTDGGKARPLLTGVGNRCWPILSPDDKHVAFLSDADGFQKVFEQDLENGTLRQLSFHSETTIPYAYSRDGSKLLCVAVRDHADTKRAGRAVYLPTKERGAERVLFDVEAFEPCASPDGKRFLFVRKQSKYLYRLRAKSSLSGQIWMYDTETRRFSLLVKRDTESRTPIWTPDGKGFYYVSGQDRTMNVWHRNLASGKERQVTFFKGESVIHPSLSKDGHTMVFRQQFDFYKIDPTLDRPAPKKIELTPVAYTPRPKTRRRYYEECWNNDSSGDVDFCNNGMQIAYTTGGDLFVTDTVVKEPRLVHGSSLTQERDCVFSPDGSALYYVSDRGDGSDLWVATLADTNQQWWSAHEFVKRRLVSDSVIRRDLQISPDGKYLSWMTRPGGLTVADTNGVPVNQIPSHWCINHTWSGDSKWLAAALEDDDGNSDIWIVPAVRNNKYPPYNVSRDFHWDGMPAWSQDGKTLAFVGLREDTNRRHLFYVWLNPKDEAAAEITDKVVKAHNTAAGGDKKGDAAKKAAPVKIDFTDLDKRVRRLPHAGEYPFFSPFANADERWLWFRADGGTYKLNLLQPGANPIQTTKNQGIFRKWYKKNDILCWIVGNKPAHFNNIFTFTSRQDTNLADYQELAFRSAWGVIRDRFYDPGFHGVDWNRVRDKYLPWARDAATPSVFERVMEMMVGELNASHLGFYRTDNSKKEWEKTVSFQSWDNATAHLGLTYDQEYTGKGWRIKSVIPEGPAARTACGIRPGDIVETVDTRAVTPQMDPTEVLNAPKNKVFMLGIRSGTNAVREVLIKSESFSDARERVRKADCEAMCRRVHEASKNRFGYLNLSQMDTENYFRFEREMFAEGYGKDGLIIDVRYNPGGRIADALLNILCRPEHGVTMFRGATRPGYPSWLLKTPVWRKPIVVLCNEVSGSNSEIFSHAIKALKRGRLVGQPTGGNVIWTIDQPLLDVGNFRMPYNGTFLMDGTDLEWHGAVPDILVNEDLNEAVKGVDVQLEAAIRALDEDVKKYQKSHPTVKPKFAKE